MLTGKRKGIAGGDVNFDTTWNVLERAFSEIHTKNASQLSFEELYRNAYKIVLKKQGEELYNRVAQFEADWLSNNVRTDVVRLLTPPLMFLRDATGRTLSTTAERRVAGEEFLRSLKEKWEDHQVCMGMLTDVLMYMVSRSSLDSADVMGLTVGRTGPCILHRPPPTIYIRQSHGSLP